MPTNSTQLLLKALFKFPMNKNSLIFISVGFVTVFLFSPILASNLTYANNIPPPVQGPSVDCNQDPNNSACQNPPPATDNNPPPKHHTQSTTTCPDGSF